MQTTWWHFDDFTAAELYELLRFRQAIFVVEQASPYPDLDGLDQTAEHLLAHSDGMLAGCLRLIPHGAEGRIAIGRVAIAKERRGEGIARLMMRDALVRCRRDYPGYGVVLSGQTYLQPFYESLGFRPISTPYDDYGVLHVDMVLR